MDGLALAGRFPAFVERVLSAVAFAASGRSEEALAAAVQAIDECSSSYEKGRVLAALVEEKLRLSADGPVMLAAIELVAMAVGNLGVDFARCLDEKFMRTMTKILKMTTLKKSLSRDVKSKINKLLTGSQSCNPGVATDPQLHRLKRKVLYLLQLWHDSFVMQQEKLPAIFEAYRKLRAKGVEFPTVDVSMKFMVKNAEESPAFDPSLRIRRPAPHPPSSSSFSSSSSPSSSSFSSSSSPSSSSFSSSSRQSVAPYNQPPPPPALLSADEERSLRTALQFLETASRSPQTEHTLAFLASARPKLQRLVESLSADDSSLSENLPRVCSLLSLADAVDARLKGDKKISEQDEKSRKDEMTHERKRKSIDASPQSPHSVTITNRGSQRQIQLKSSSFSSSFSSSSSSCSSPFASAFALPPPPGPASAGATSNATSLSKSGGAPKSLDLLDLDPSSPFQSSSQASSSSTSSSSSSPPEATLAALNDIFRSVAGDVRTPALPEPSCSAFEKSGSSQAPSFDSLFASNSPPRPPRAVTVVPSSPGDAAHATQEDAETNCRDTRRFEAFNELVDAPFSAPVLAFSTHLALPQPLGVGIAEAKKDEVKEEKNGETERETESSHQLECAKDGITEASRGCQKRTQERKEREKMDGEDHEDCQDSPAAVLGPREKHEEKRSNASRPISSHVQSTFKSPSMLQTPSSVSRQAFAYGASCASSLSSPSSDPFSAAFAPSDPFCVASVSSSLPPSSSSASSSISSSSCSASWGFLPPPEDAPRPSAVPPLFPPPPSSSASSTSSSISSSSCSASWGFLPPPEEAHRLSAVPSLSPPPPSDAASSSSASSSSTSSISSSSCSASWGFLPPPEEAHRPSAAPSLSPPPPSDAASSSSASSSSASSTSSSISSSSCSASWGFLPPPEEAHRLSAVPSLSPPPPSDAASSSSASSSSTSSISSSSCSASWGFLPPPEEAPRPSAIPPLSPPPPSDAASSSSASSSSTSSTSSSISSSSRSASWGFLPPPEEAHRLSAVPSLSPPPPSDAASSSSASSSSASSTSSS
ncbi:hypothetical protein TGVEG_216030, partial [Toxoplasma gondii VEG]